MAKMHDFARFFSGDTRQTQEKRLNAYKTEKKARKIVHFGQTMVKSWYGDPFIT